MYSLQNVHKYTISRNKYENIATHIYIYTSKDTDFCFIFIVQKPNFFHCGQSIDAFNVVRKSP